MDLPRAPQRPYHCHVSIWDKPADDWITSIVGEPTSTYDSITKSLGVPVQPRIECAILGLDADHLSSIYMMAGNHDSPGGDLYAGTSLCVPVIAKQLARIAKRFAVQPSFTVIPASGRYLQEMEVASARLDTFREALYQITAAESLRSLYFGEPVDCHFQLPLIDQTAECGHNEMSAASLYSLASINFVTYSTYKISILQRLLSGLQRKICQTIKLVRRSFYTPVPRYCGLGWSRRLWFLLHGSHPPKALALLPA
jgi:hypothetical protein